MASTLLLLSGCVGSGPETKATATTPVPSPSVDVGEGTECLNGYVTDDELVPLSEASVGLVEANASLTTGVDGSFEFCGLTAGTYTLHVARLGYFESAQRVDVPHGPTRLHVELKPIPVKETYFLTVPKTVHYTFGMSTIDTTTNRNVAGTPTCNPCTWSTAAPTIPDFLVWEAKWTRTVPPPGPPDSMYYILRGGAPFEQGTDIGSFTSLPQPWRVDYTKEKLLTNANVKTAAAKGEVPLSGSMFCTGGPAAGVWPCVDQRIDMWISFLYDYAESDVANFTALPKS